MSNRGYHFCEDIEVSCPADWFELTYVLEGHGMRTAYACTQEISEGCWFLSEAEHPSAFENRDGLRIFRFFFPPVFIDTALLDCKTLQELSFSYLIHFPYHIAPSFTGSMIFHDENAKVRTLFETIKSENEESNRGYVEYIRCYTLQILLQICRSVTYVKAQSLDTQYIRGIYDYCIDHYMEDIKLSDLCQLANYSLSHVSEQFKKITGVNFRTFLQRTRIMQSCRYLSLSSKPIDEIAALCGYQDLHAFFRAFKAYTGMTPHQYRQQNTKQF